MNKRLLLLLVVVLMTVSAPLMAAAQAPDGDKRNSEPRPSLDWKAYPADIQALKVQLDSIRDEQKGLFDQMKEQHQQIRDARKTLTDKQRKTLKRDAQKIIEQMKSTRDSIHTLRDQKRTTWDNFHAHSKEKQWNDAKTDLQAIVQKKQQILDNQKNILKLQQQLLLLMKPSASTHFHME